MIGSGTRRTRSPNCSNQGADERIEFMNAESANGAPGRLGDGSASVVEADSSARLGSRAPGASGRSRRFGPVHPRRGRPAGSASRPVAHRRAGPFRGLSQPGRSVYEYIHLREEHGHERKRYSNLFGVRRRRPRQAFLCRVPGGAHVQRVRLPGTRQAELPAHVVDGGRGGFRNLPDTIQIQVRVRAHSDRVLRSAVPAAKPAPPAALRRSGVAPSGDGTVPGAEPGHNDADCRDHGDDVVGQTEWAEHELGGEVDG